MKFKVKKLIVNSASRPVAFRCYVYDRKYSRDRYYIDIPYDTFKQLPTIQSSKNHIVKTYNGDELMYSLINKLGREQIEYTTPVKIYTSDDVCAKDRGMLKCLDVDGRKLWSTAEYEKFIENSAYHNKLVELEHLKEIEKLHSYKVLSFAQTTYVKLSLSICFIFKLDMPTNLSEIIMCDEDKEKWFCEVVKEEVVDIIKSECSSMRVEHMTENVFRLYIDYKW